MKFSEERLKQFEDYDLIRNSKLSKSEQSEIDNEAITELAALREIQDEISKQLAIYLAKENIGIVTFNERFKVSSKQTNNILKGEANLTLATLVEFSHKIGKKPKIVFEDEEIA